MAAVRFNKKILIVETPGIIDTATPNDVTQQEMSKCIGITSPGPHAFIFVINAAIGFTEEDQRSIDLFVRQFGEHFFQYVFVLFTLKDELDGHNINLETRIKYSPPKLKSFIEKCGGRAIAFDNTLEGVKLDTQVEDLLKEIKINLERNGSECYTNEMYKEAKMEIQKIEREKKNLKNKKTEENKKKFKERRKKRMAMSKKRIDFKADLDILNKNQK